MSIFKIRKILQTKINLLNYIKKYITVKQRGSQYIGLCPFHVEYIPSFYITKKYYKCFGCGLYGDIVSFIAKMINRSQIFIIFYLSKKYHLNTINIKISIHFKNKIRIKYILNLLHIFFQKNLFDINNVAIKYLIKYRKINVNSIKYYSLGYGGISNYKFFLFIKYHSIRIHELLILGLIKFYKIWYFIFLNKIIFPIKNIYGETISFIGRCLFYNKHKNNKYINCKNSIIYNKSKAIFGLYEALYSKNSLIAQNIIVVEGLFDAISINAVGFTSISINGTNVNISQIKIICSYFPKIFICLDYDYTGKSYSLFLLKLLLKYNIMPKIIFIHFKDPNCIVSKCNSIFLIKQVIYSINYVDYLITLIISNIYDYTYNHIKYINNILILIQQLNSKNIRNYYYNRIKLLLSKKYIFQFNYIDYCSYLQNNKRKYLTSQDRFFLIFFFNCPNIYWKMKYFIKLINYSSIKTKLFFIECQL